MGNSRFVRPDVVVLKISNGDTLTVKRRLNSGEQRAAYARMYLAGVDGALKVNPIQTGVALITAYLLDWSLTDDGRKIEDGGKPVVIRDLSVESLTATLDALDQESFVEIKEAIEAHELAMQKEREEARNFQGGEKGDSATSPSHSGATGPSIKSEVLM